MQLSPRLPGSSRVLLPWLNLVLLANASCLLFLADDFLQQLFLSGNRAELELGYVFVLWIFSASLWLCNLRVLTLTLLPSFAVMQFMQLGNISFFGEPLDAIDIQSLAKDPAEVRQAALHGFSQHWPV